MFGTDECSWLPENTIIPPTSGTTRTCGSSSTGSSGVGWSRVSLPIWLAAANRLVRFHSA